MKKLLKKILNFIKRLFTPEAVIIQPEVVEVRENSNDSLKGLSAAFLERCEELRKMEEERSRKLDKGLFLFSSYLEKRQGFLSESALSLQKKV